MSLKLPSSPSESKPRLRLASLQLELTGVFFGHRYDRALLLFRASRGLFKEYEGKVRSTGRGIPVAPAIIKCTVSSGPKSDGSPRFD